MSRLKSLLLVALLLPATTLAGPLAEPVVALLDGYERAPTPEDFRALGEGAQAELLEIAADADAPTTRRGRALTALAFYPNTETRAVLDATLADAESKSLLRRKAAYAVGVGFGADAIPALTAALGDADPQLRMAAASALGAVGTDAAKAALSARRDLETEDAVRTVLNTFLEAGE